MIGDLGWAFLNTLFCGGKGHHQNRLVEQGCWGSPQPGV